MKYITALLIGLFLMATVGQATAQDAVQKSVPAKAEAVKTPNLWKTLSKITFKKEYDEMLGFKVDIPVFSEDIKKLEGKEVTIKGYIIPIEGYKSHKEFIFSAFPYNMCFFCGGAGPETVMEVMATEAVEYTAEPVMLRGKLSLNSTDVNRLMYELTDAVKVELDN